MKVVADVPKIDFTQFSSKKQTMALQILCKELDQATVFRPCYRAEGFPHSRSR